MIWRLFALWALMLTGVVAVLAYGQAQPPYILQRQERGFYADLHTGNRWRGQATNTTPYERNAVSPDGRYMLTLVALDRVRFTLSDAAAERPIPVLGGEHYHGFGQVRWLPGEVRLYGYSATKRAMLAVDLTDPVAQVRVLADLSHISGDVREVQVAPDGERVAFRVDAEAAHRAQVFDLHTGATTVYPLPPTAGRLRWLSPGVLLYEVGACFQRLPLATGTPTEICLPGTTAQLGLWSLSPDGTQVAVRWWLGPTQQRALPAVDLKVLHLETGTMRTIPLLAAGQAANKAGTLSWSPDGRYVYTEFYGAQRVLRRVADVPRGVGWTLRVPLYRSGWVTPQQMRPAR